MRFQKIGLTTVVLCTVGNTTELFYRYSYKRKT